MNNSLFFYLFLVSYDYIISSAHCFPDIEAAKKLKVLTGYRNYPAEDDDYQGTYEIESVVVHEQYQTSPNIYDIAIIKLTSSVDYNLGVSTVCLPIGKSFQLEDFYWRSKTFDLVAWPKYK